MVYRCRFLPDEAIIGRKKTHTPSAVDRSFCERRALQLVQGLMVPNGDLTNADASEASNAVEIGVTGQMASLVGKIVDLGHILNAQLRIRGRARAPLSVRLRGRIHLSGCGEVVLGKGVSFNGTVVPVELVTYESGRIEIGDHTFINYGSSVAARASVKIGAHCLLGHYTFVMDNDQHDIVRHTELPESSPVVIEDYVWIGSKTVILAGVRIGSRAVIGAGSIVTKDIPPQCVAAGNPARVLRRLTELDLRQTEKSS